MEKIKVGIIGAGGYGGCGAVELLQAHPHAEITALIDKQDVGRRISDLYPHLQGFCDLPIVDPEDPDCPDDFQVVFFSTPDGVGQKGASQWLNRGVKVIDYSGDFRFNDLETYRGYAARIGRKEDHASPDLLPRSVYGLCELHRKEIAGTDLVGNPGCFAVSCILGLAPAIKSGLIDTGSVICDAKTGVSGAGKTPNPLFHYPARYDSMNAYRISGHQHVYEIERELGLVAGEEIKITFTPHVVPLCRGILTTIYARLDQGQDLKGVEEVYRSFYHNEAFVRVFGPEVLQVSTNVRGSNFCNLSLNVDERTGNLIVVSLIDNLVKGQAGSAVQNMNVLFGLDETAGLLHPGIYP
ncbi:MAG: N-acetyl-gamma-glutamyl-phosphate reductase [Deltaproteobacteria bacterium]|nr:N-acetyl-gamma-glutamyl-phosphate reductase [Deltaproteobacteria bacterium]MBW2048789.1 N-acetyl-gamma-glutamyl-phosphate reductase [Deltaproteobacteria bacterium]MBW2112504.1 N-acetyl-gamma-glutamyl-phosphate reductase [Deltaproteobacteria bacterium]MBW2353862.1 N-acetyl-gamma-glutamyl-phosphate reductase [Deltaproteobacteria bacterium]HDZ89702.1 N-acetyl-gamma-glutamyl-phosphate reductase [Deltaproteobacteria bacterium]